MGVKKLLMAAWKKLPIPFFMRRWYTYLSNRRFPVGVDGVILNDAGEVLIFTIHTARLHGGCHPAGSETRIRRRDLYGKCARTPEWILR